MKRLVPLFGLLATLVLAAFSSQRVGTDSAPAADQAVYTVDNVHSLVGFKVRHLGIANVRGSFGDYEINATVNPEDLSTLTATATINVASIDTRNERRDGHLKSADFFDAENYPTITFVSKEVRDIDGTNFTLVGDLTIKDVTKEIELDAEYLGAASMMGSNRLAFEAAGEVNRFDYGLKWNKTIEAGGLVVAETVRLVLEVELKAAE